MTAETRFPKGDLAGHVLRTRKNLGPTLERVEKLKAAAPISSGMTLTADGVAVYPLQSGSEHDHRRHEKKAGPRSAEHRCERCRVRWMQSLLRKLKGSSLGPATRSLGQIERV